MNHPCRNSSTHKEPSLRARSQMTIMDAPSDQ